MAEKRKRKPYANAKRSEAALRQALIDEIREGKTVGTISISDLVKRANVNRGTFYNHYRNINDVVNDIELDLVNGTYDLWRAAKEDPRPLETFFASVNAYVREGRNRYDGILSRLPTFIYKDVKTMSHQLCDSIFSEFTNDDENKRRLYIVMDGACNQYIDYLIGLNTWELEDISSSAIALVRNILGN
jgi:AcrR family transcriptional regulator